MKLGNWRAKKAPREMRFLIYGERNIRIVSDLATETWQVRKGWQDVFRLINEKYMQPRQLYPARLSFRTDGEIKSF